MRRGDPGYRRLASDAENHDFALDLAHGRLIYIRGAYPRKSYLCSQSLTKNDDRCHRVTGYSLGDGVFPLKDGRTAFVDGVHYVDDLYVHADDTLPPHALLRVDLDDGHIVRSYALKEGAKVLAVVEPRWDKEPVIALEDGDVVGLARAGADQSLKEAGLKLGLSRPDQIAVAEDYPAVAATSWGMHGASLRFFDATTGAMGKDLGVNSPGLVKALDGNRWLITMQDSQTGRDTVTELDQSRGRITALISCDGAVSSVALGERWLYAVSQSSKGTFDPKRKWLHPQELHRVDLQHPGPAWSIPWTQRPGTLLGVDSTRGRIYYAVTDRDQAGVWAVDAQPAALARAAAAMDRKFALTEGMLSGAVLGLLFGTFFIGLIWVLINPPR